MICVFYVKMINPMENTKKNEKSRVLCPAYAGYPDQQASEHSVSETWVSLQSNQ